MFFYFFLSEYPNFNTLHNIVVHSAGNFTLGGNIYRKAFSSVYNNIYDMFFFMFIVTCRRTYIYIIEIKLHLIKRKITKFFLFVLFLGLN